MERVYRQSWAGITYNGVQLQGLMDGAPIVVRHRGGEVDLTEGTDGSSVNIATDQGGEVEVTLRETATTHGFLYNQHRNQQHSGPGATLIVYTGVGAVISLTDAYVGMPSELSTGDKQMGSRTYRFVSSEMVECNL